MLNIIINPVKRWFHTEKPIPDEEPKGVDIYMVKDSNGNDVLIFMGHLNREYAGFIG